MRLHYLIIIAAAILVAAALAAKIAINQIDSGEEPHTNVILLDEQGRPLTVIEPSPGDPGSKLIDMDGNEVDAPSRWKSANE